MQSKRVGIWFSKQIKQQIWQIQVETCCISIEAIFLDNHFEVPLGGWLAEISLWAFDCGQETNSRC